MPGWACCSDRRVGADIGPPVRVHENNFATPRAENVAQVPQRTAAFGIEFHSSTDCEASTFGVPAQLPSSVDNVILTFDS